MSDMERGAVEVGQTDTNWWHLLCHLTFHKDRGKIPLTVNLFSSFFQAQPKLLSPIFFNIHIFFFHFCHLITFTFFLLPFLQSSSFFLLYFCNLEFFYFCNLAFKHSCIISFLYFSILLFLNSCSLSSTIFCAMWGGVNLDRVAGGELH